jgi:hypothetical protein
MVKGNKIMKKMEEKFNESKYYRCSETKTESGEKGSGGSVKRLLITDEEKRKNTLPLQTWVLERLRSTTKVCHCSQDTMEGDYYSSQRHTFLNVEQNRSAIVKISQD